VSKMMRQFHFSLSQRKAEKSAPARFKIEHSVEPQDRAAVAKSPAASCSVLSLLPP
jgi:hypothetical protein